jgi:UDP-N-acetylglucosamine acyltransferase
MILTETHATAVVHPTAEIGAGTSIGPYAVIGPAVVIGEGSQIGAHVVIERDTTLGRACVVHTGAVLGGDAQDLKYRGEPAQLIIGDRTRIREFVTLNRGTAARGSTEIGSDCLLMAYVHVAHDCVIGNHVVLANSVNMGGHVEIEDWAIVGGLTAIHQFARIGAHAFVGGSAAVQKDVAPYVKAAGNPLRLFGLNGLGLQRRGFSEAARSELKRAYRLFFHSNLNISQALARAREELEPLPEVERFIDFIERSERGVTV